MLKRWDIVGVPGDMWPWDDSASDFLAIIVSTNWAREKTGIIWFCPIREGADRVTGEGFIPIRQTARTGRPPISWKLPVFSRRDAALPAPANDFKKIPFERPIARLDLLITGGRHEIFPWDFGTVDRNTRVLLRKELRKFVGA